MTYEPWMLAAIDQAGYNQKRKQLSSNYARCGIAPDRFTQEDLNRLEYVMNAD